jgi:single-strand DNA-binding protein
MAYFNRVILLGNVTRDIELRYTQSGMAVTDVGLAVNERRKNQAGEWVDEPMFVDCRLFGRTAEVASEYLSKGSPVLIEGRLKLDTWEHEGQKRSKLYVIGDRMQLIGTRGQGGGGQGGQGGGAPGRQERPPQESSPDHGRPAYNDMAPPAGHGPPSGPPEDDIPF